MKKIIIIFLLIWSLFIKVNSIFANEDKKIYLFYSLTCPHCFRARDFLDKLVKKDPEIKVEEYEISANTQKLINFYEKYDVSLNERGLVPIIFLKDKYYLGFNKEIGEKIKADLIENIQKINTAKTKNNIINNLNLTNLSLPTLSIVLGFIDGFNICSLGALLIILSLVLGLRSRIKILVFGSIFILTTSIVYGLLIFFWYQLFSFISLYLRRFEILVGMLSIFGGIYFLKEFIKFKKQGPRCDLGLAQKVEKKFSFQFKKLVENKTQFLAMVLLVFLFALVITVVEFPCSAAVPLAYAGVLTQAKISGLLYLFYIGLYVFFYMIDEIIVFLIAFFSLKLWLASPKFVTWLTLIESIILFILGGYYLFGL